ncbi:restriction endonuclease subunit R [Bacillus sp. OVS6]|nr:restriction endonuclease subunit R [Bacillus sp. OVS6]
MKVTGTPFRSDGRTIEGKEIYTYGLGKAMARGYVKSLEKIDYIPGKVYLTLDKNSDELYTIEQIREMGLRDEDWIRRSVALSTESNMSIIDQSLKFLSEKKEKTGNPHKIIAVACSIWHAEQLKVLYEAKGFRSSIVHSELEKHERELEFDKINSNQVDIVINVAMLGEGYDHKFLSIAALFRPYKTLLPYAQFIGRVLRSISEDDVNGNLSEEDNIAAAIHHKELGLDELWDYYKKEIKKRDIIKRIRTDYPIEPTDRSPSDVSFGSVSESEEYSTTKDAFIESELINLRKQKIKEEQEKINNLQQLLDVSEEKARIIYQQSLKSQEKERYLRPDLYLKKKKAEIDQLVREDVIPQLLVDFELELSSNELANGKYILPKRYEFIYSRAKDNGSLLGQYFNLSLKHHIGEGRDGWKLDDYDRAIGHVQELEVHLRKILEKNI